MNPPPSPGTERLPPKKRDPRQRPCNPGPNDDCFKAPAPYGAPVRGRPGRESLPYAVSLPLTPPGLSVPWHMSCPAMAPNNFPFDQTLEGRCSWREQYSRRPTEPGPPYHGWGHTPMPRPTTGHTSHSDFLTNISELASCDLRMDRVPGHCRVPHIGNRKDLSEWRSNGMAGLEMWGTTHRSGGADRLSPPPSRARVHLVYQSRPDGDHPRMMSPNSPSQEESQHQAELSTATPYWESSGTANNCFSSHREHPYHNALYKPAETRPRPPAHAHQLHPGAPPHSPQAKHTLQMGAADRQALSHRCEPGDVREEVREVSASEASPPFAGSSLVELGGGRLKRVAELRTEDFLLCGRTGPGVHLSSCTVLCIAPCLTPGHTYLQVLLADRHTQELLEVLVEYPFFVCDRGWSSCSPQRTAQLYGLRCRELAVGDVCLALTPSPAPTDTLPPAAVPPSDLHGPHRGPTEPPPQPLKRRWSAPELPGPEASQTLSPHSSKHKREQQ